MNKQIVLTAIFAMFIGGGAGYWASLQANKGAGASVAVETVADDKPLFYRHPMNPEITSPVPAKDDMNMDYIPVYADGAADDGPAGTVKIDSVVAQNIGVRTTSAVRKTLTRNIRSIGRVDYDEKRVTRLHPKVNGWIKRLFIDSTGAPVKKNNMLLSIYSPQLVSSQQEYLLALKNAEILKDSSFPDIRNGALSLARSSRERLELLDVPKHQLRDLRKKGKIIQNLHIHSPFDGIVIKVGVRQGQYVTPATELYTIADLSRIWVFVDIYEDEMPWVQVGDMAEMKVTGIPGRTFSGRVTYIYPYLDAKTRTNKVRLEFANLDLSLKPEMFAHVSLKASRQIDAVVVPSEAIVRTGGREQVFISKGAGKFEPRIVKLGIEADGEVQIIEGLQAGELVVTSAQFLIDSDSKLNEATAKMLEASKPSSATQDMNMDRMDIQIDSMDMGDHSTGQPNGKDAGRPKGEGQDVTNQMKTDSMQMPEQMRMGDSQ
jgi:Cu(I)/Ag(I) efflux system membrane fusion protein